MKAMGFEINSDMMSMMNGFTVLRLFTLMGGMMNMNFTKEQLLDLNKKLNKIRKPKEMKLIAAGCCSSMAERQPACAMVKPAIKCANVAQFAARSLQREPERDIISQYVLNMAAAHAAR